MSTRSCSSHSRLRACSSLCANSSRVGEHGRPRPRHEGSDRRVLPRTLLLGSSLSSGATRRPFQICHEALEDGIGDAPLEAPQRFLTGFALCDLLAVVGPAPNVRPGLADGYPMCRALLSLRFPASESLCLTTSPLEASPPAPCQSRRQSEPWSGNVPHCLP